MAGQQGPGAPAQAKQSTASPGASPAAGQPASPPAIYGWALTWSDEFNGPNGSPPDPTKWTYDTGGNGWGNQELEYYTRHRENAYVENGHLVMRAIREEFTGPDGVSRHYTSARLKTEGIFAQEYGRFEARIKIPEGQGIWPAFWLLGNNIEKTQWPECGEIDIMENIGREPTEIHGSMHGPGYSGDLGLTAPARLESERPFAEEYHIYAIEWEPQVVRFYVDSDLYATFTPMNLAPGLRWVFDHPFFILLNVAVGGGWPGAPDETTVFPQTMLVDYVRVYKKTTPEAP